MFESERELASAAGPGSDDHRRTALWDFRAISLFAPDAPRTSPSALQPKLVLGQIQDPFEREADRMADQVMSTPAVTVPTDGKGLEAHGGPAASEVGETRLWRARAGAHAGVHRTAGDVSAEVVEALGTEGRPLDAETRSFMESRFGHDFGSVRVHSGKEAARAAHSVGARAFALGRDIAFGERYYAPGTAVGRRLIAHELTHVLQQRLIPAVIQRDPLPKYQSTDPVVELKWVPEPEGDGWQLTVEGDFTTPESIGRMIWPGRPKTPLGVLIKPLLVMQASAQWPGKKWSAEATTATFVLTGVDASTLQTMDPLFAQKFAEAGLRKEPKSVEDARARFREAHRGFADYDLIHIDAALRRVTRNNPDLLEAYYRFYADWTLTDDLEGEAKAGATDRTIGRGGFTKINPGVLHRRHLPHLPTDDTLSLLGTTLIHEYVHTAHASDYLKAPGEGKAYGVENFFNERLSDTARDDETLKLGATEGDKTAFDASYRVMKLLYEVIDGHPSTSPSLKGVSPQHARELSVEFISKNKKDFSKELEDLIKAETQATGLASLPSQEN
jgi:hypothetical protein